MTALYYADPGYEWLADEAVTTDGVNVWVSYEPSGLVLAVRPWNFPVWQVMRFAFPSLVAGNGVLLKHSPNVTGSVLALQQLFVDAGIPANVLTTLVVAEPEVPKVIEGPHRGRDPDRVQPRRSYCRRGGRACIEEVSAGAGVVWTYSSCWAMPKSMLLRRLR